MALDGSVAALLDMLAQMGGAPLEQLTPVEARATFAGMALLAGEGADVAGVVNRDIAGVPALVATPHGEGPFPVLVWIHGGGWVIGNAAESEPLIRDLAAKAGCIVASLDYRLAPEHKAPAAVEDCIAATGWLLDHADELGGDPSRVAVGGDSAGGNLSALVALEFGRRLSFQALIYPAVDMTDTEAYPSRVDNAEGYLLTEAGMIWFRGHYLDGTEYSGNEPAVSPIHASDEAIAQVAPAYVLTAEYDPLRDEGEAYAARLAANGVPVTARRFDGMIHAFYTIKGAIPTAVEAHDQTAALLRGAWEA